jgi:iron complex transport system substrate-binding protein
MKSIFLKLSLLALLAAAAAPCRAETSGGRIVSLAPSLTEIIFELGLSESVVGVTSYCDRPPDAALKEKVGDYLNPAIEKIVSLKPDTVFSLADGKTARILRNMGIKVYVFDPQDFVSLKKTVADIGRIAGRPEAAAALISEMDSTVRQEKNRAASRPMSERPRLYIETNYPPPWSCSDKSFLGEAAGFIGCRNIFAVARKGFFPVSSETIIRENPDVILVLSGDENIASRTGFAGINAVKNSNVIIWSDRGALVRAAPRMIRSLPALRKRIFKDED